MMRFSQLQGEYQRVNLREIPGKSYSAISASFQNRPFAAKVFQDAIPFMNASVFDSELYFGHGRGGPILFLFPAYRDAEDCRVRCPKFREVLAIDGFQENVIRHVDRPLSDNVHVRESCLPDNRKI